MRGEFYTIKKKKKEYQNKATDYFLTNLRAFSVKAMLKDQPSENTTN